MDLNTKVSHQMAEKTWQDFKKLGRMAREYKAKAQVLIPLLAESQIFLKHGYASLEHAANELAGINAATVSKIMSVHKRTENLPALRKTMQTKGYAKVDAVLVLAKKLPDRKLAELSESLPTKTLRQKVQDLKHEFKIENKGQVSLFLGGLDNEEKFSEPKDFSSDYKNPSKFIAESNDDLEQKLNKIKHKLSKEKGHFVTNKDLLEYLVGLEENKNPRTASKPQKQEYPRANKNKTLTKKHKEHVKAQNNNICSHPNCNKVATEIHHNDYQSLNQNNPDRHRNIIPLCKLHHQIQHSKFAPSYRKKSPEQIQIDGKVQKFWCLE